MKKNNFKIIELKSKRNKNTIKRTVLIKDFIIHEIIGIHKNEKINIKNNLIAAGKLLGILRKDPDVWLGYNQSSNPEKEEIEGLINQRNEARRDKDFKLADEIRDKLKIKGIEIEDTKNGTIWRKDS